MEPRWQGCSTDALAQFRGAPSQTLVTFYDSLVAPEPPWEHTVHRRVPHGILRDIRLAVGEVPARPPLAAPASMN